MHDETQQEYHKLIFPFKMWVVFKKIAKCGLNKNSKYFISNWRQSNKSFSQGKAPLISCVKVHRKMQEMKRHEPLMSANSAQITANTKATKERKSTECTFKKAFGNEF